MKGKILLISGPSGSGKSTLLGRLLKEFPNTYFSISSTTREPRNGEIHGVNYYFVSEEDFKKGIENNEFLEWAKVHSNYYGTPLKPVEEALELGKTVIFDIDVQGFHLAKKIYGNNITSIFLTTKNRKDLESRLRHRAKDSEEIIQNRLLNAASEMGHMKEYKFLIINDDLEDAYKKLRAIFLVNEIKTKNLDLDEISKQWIN